MISPDEDYCLMRSALIGEGVVDVGDDRDVDLLRGEPISVAFGASPLDCALAVGTPTRALLATIRPTDGAQALRTMIPPRRAFDPVRRVRGFTVVSTHLTQWVTEGQPLAASAVVRAVTPPK
jgi:hypothetical protein